MERRRYDDAELVRCIGGPHGAVELPTGRLEERGQLYWPRSWGARGLLYAWDESAAPAVVAALADEAWRVREMAAKVVVRREIGAAADALVPLLDDEVPSRMSTRLDRDISDLAAGTAYGGGEE